MNTIEHKILAVDDNKINTKLLSRTLTNNNFSVLTASSGKEAIGVVSDQKPDLILLDVLMPDMDGYETCKILKENPESSHIPIIFLSAKNETIDKAKGFALGACDYLTKPFDPIEIVARIRSHIAIRRDVIELSRKNEDLKERLKKTENNNGFMEGKNGYDAFQFIDKLTNINYMEVNKAFKIQARVKFSKPPVTSIFIPAYLDDQSFAYLIAGGFEKDYKTAIVQLLLEQYAKGLFAAKNEKILHEKELYNIFNLILDTFSPDVYKTAFTISFGYLNAIKSEFTNFSIHQSPPLILNNKNELVSLEPRPVFYESRYAKIIKASRGKLPPKASIITYLSGKDLREEHFLEDLIKNNGKKNSTTHMPTIEQYFKNLPEKETDQLIMSATLL